MKLQQLASFQLRGGAGLSITRTVLFLVVLEKMPQDLSSCNTSAPAVPPVTNVFFFRFGYSGSMATDCSDGG